MKVKDLLELIYGDETAITIIRHYEMGQDISKHWLFVGVKKDVPFSTLDRIIENITVTSEILDEGKLIVEVKSTESDEDE